jgi:hypothetical protein
MIFIVCHRIKKARLTKQDGSSPTKCKLNAQPCMPATATVCACCSRCLVWQNSLCLNEPPIEVERKSAECDIGTDACPAHPKWRCQAARRGSIGGQHQQCSAQRSHVPFFARRDDQQQVPPGVSHAGRGRGDGGSIFGRQAEQRPDIVLGRR